MGSKRDKLKRVLRKAVKWGGAGLTVLLLVVWVGSGCYRANWRIAAGTSVEIGAGRLEYSEVSLFSDLARHGWATPEVGLRSIAAGEPELNWSFRRADLGKALFVFIPLWPAVLLSLLATAAAWRADAKYLRRARVGMCPACGYDRAGLAPGAVCPECGNQPEAQ